MALDRRKLATLYESRELPLDRWQEFLARARADGYDTIGRALRAAIDAYERERGRSHDDPNPRR